MKAFLRKYAWILMEITAAMAAGISLYTFVRPLLQEKAPAPLASDGGRPEEERMRLFRLVMKDEPAWRVKSEETFPGLPWSMEDHRAASERDRVHAVASQKQMSVSEVYAIIDEGIRRHWPYGDTSEVIRATTPPLEPRRD